MPKAQLVVGFDTTTIAQYAYYGDNRRSKKVISHHGPQVVANDNGNTDMRFYYCTADTSRLRASVPSCLPWSICETRNGSG